MRLSDAEREQIAGAARPAVAAADELCTSGGAAGVGGRREGVSVKAPERKAPDRELRGVVVLGEAPAHSFVEGICVRCGRDTDERESAFVQ
jgi:hypothetical protein